jgi:site-specific recombinase XerD
MDAEGLLPQDLTRDRLQAFLRHRINCGYTCCRTLRGIEPILVPLRDQGMVPPPEPPPAENTPLAQLLREYETYLLEDRGLAPSTTLGSLRTAGQFFGDVGVCDLETLRRLSASDISGFVLRQANTMAVSSAKLMVTQLRALLRFLHVRGLCGQLAAAAPALAGHRLSRLPKHIPWEEVQQLLDSCDLGTSVGQRDHAILLLLSRLGLRAGEVAALELGDMHWHGGRILVHGKGGRQDWLPLAQDVGEAIVGYLQGARPPTTSRKLFLQSRAPHGDLSTGTINALVRQASRRAHLPLRSAHQLRHTAATQMLRAGVSLQGVAEVLRHLSLDTTAIYAKVDHLALRSLARPWPGDES